MEREAEALQLPIFQSVWTSRGIAGGILTGVNQARYFGRIRKKSTYGHNRLLVRDDVSLV